MNCNRYRFESVSELLGHYKDLRLGRGYPETPEIAEAMMEGYQYSLPPQHLGHSIFDSARMDIVWLPRFVEMGKKLEWELMREQY